MAFLPGDVRDRIADLRFTKKMSREELAARVGVSRSTISRLESGDVRKVNADVVINVAKEFGVSSDFVLGLSNIPDRSNYEVTQLGLSEGAIKAMLSDQTDSLALNLLLENPDFGLLTHQIRVLFEDALEKGVQNQNAILNQSVRLLNEYREDHPEHAEGIERDKRFISGKKSEPHEEDYLRITNRFLNVLKTMKQQLDKGRTPEPALAETLGLRMEEFIREENEGKIKAQTPEQMAMNAIRATKEMSPQMPDWIWKPLYKITLVFYRMGRRKQ